MIKVETLGDALDLRGAKTREADDAVEKAYNFLLSKGKIPFFASSKDYFIEAAAKEASTDDENIENVVG